MLFRSNLIAPKKAGKYTEHFVLVFEGKAVVLNSTVTVKINVTESKKSSPKIYTPEQFLEAVGWNYERYPDETKNFLDWFGVLVKTDFKYYKNMRPVSCMVFLKNYIETNHPNIKITKSMINKGLKLEKIGRAHV